MDEDLKYDDKLAMDRMGQILSDHSKEMENFVPKETPGLPMPKEGPPTATLLQRMGTRDEVSWIDVDHFRHCVNVLLVRDWTT